MFIGDFICLIKIRLEIGNGIKKFIKYRGFKNHQLLLLLTIEVEIILFTIHPFVIEPVEQLVVIPILIR